MVNYTVYDTEIVRCIPPKDGVLVPGLQYCKGWSDFDGMGLAVVGMAIVEGNDVEYRSFIVDPMVGQVSDLEALDIQFEFDMKKVVGFNSIGFDDRLMTANGFNVRSDYDLLLEVRVAAGFTADYRSVPKGYSYNLHSLAKENGMAKTGSGELAPVLWQQGQYQEVIDYCLMDVKITHELLLLGWAGDLVDPNTGKKLWIRGLE